MFGRVRASSSSPDELERPTAKLLKHDSLSIYESTLLKLRIGSQHAKDTPPEEVLHTENDGMDVRADSICTSTVRPEAIVAPQVSVTADDGVDSPGCTAYLSTDCPGTFSSKHCFSSSRTISIHHMFSTFEDSKAASSYDRMMMTTEEYCNNPTIPPNPRNYSCVGNMDQQQQLEPECISSITVGSV